MKTPTKKNPVVLSPRKEGKRLAVDLAKNPFVIRFAEDHFKKMLRRMSLKGAWLESDTTEVWQESWRVPTEIRARWIATNQKGVRFVAPTRRIAIRRACGIKD